MLNILTRLTRHLRIPSTRVFVSRVCFLIAFAVRRSGLVTYSGRPLRRRDFLSAAGLLAVLPGSWESRGAAVGRGLAELPPREDHARGVKAKSGRQALGPGEFSCVFLLTFLKFHLPCKPLTHVN